MNPVGFGLLIPFACLAYGLGMLHARYLFTRWSWKNGFVRRSEASELFEAAQAVVDQIENEGGMVTRSERRLRNALSSIAAAHPSQP